MSKRSKGSNLRFLATDHELDESGHGLHQRDQTGRPKRGLAGISDPRDSDLVMSLMGAINARLSHLDRYATEPMPDLDYESIFAAAGLTEQEAKAWELRSSGFSIGAIALFMNGLEEATVEVYLSRGRGKLRVWARLRKAS